MSDPDTFIDLVNNLCRLPSMYTLNGTFSEVAAYLMGHERGSPESEIYDVRNALGFFVTAKLAFPSKYWWPYVIQTVAKDDADAIELTRQLLVEFATLRKTHSFEDICRDAHASVSNLQDSVPAKVWRQLSRALFRRQRCEIEPLILPHPDAEVLWKGDAYPIGVAEQLNDLSDSQPVTVVGGSEQSGSVTVITNIGCVDLKIVDGKWLVDASRIIAHRMGT